MSRTGEQTDGKTSPEKLLPEIAAQFSVYIGKGLEFNSVFQNSNPDLNINGLDELLDLHFILTGDVIDADQTAQRLDAEGNEPGVKDFVSKLPVRLRRLRTTTQRRTRVYNGEIRGRVDWQETIKTRYRTGNTDEPLYACQLAEETVAIPENILLWELIEEIQDAYDEVDGLLQDGEDISWFSDWRGDSQLVANLENAQSNVHLSELDELQIQQKRVSDRTIRDVLDARTPLYSEAAQLLRRYRRLQDHEIDDREAKNLLSRRLFGPAPDENWADDETPTFFELYWIFKLLASYDAAQRNLITKSTSCVASWTERESEYELFHDWNGGSEFEFGESYLDRERESALPGEDRFLGRLTELLSMQERETKEVFGHRRPTKKSRLPDFVLLRRENDIVQDIAIGEVKYTRSSQTAANGLEQLYRYMIFARETLGTQPRYFTAAPDHFETPTVHGYLCVDDIEIEREPAGNVSVMAVGDEFPNPPLF
jgi:hypothetical protein